MRLRREVLPQPELIDELVSKARKIQGARDVESFLHLPQNAGSERAVAQAPLEL